MCRRTLWRVFLCLTICAGLWQTVPDPSEPAARWPVSPVLLDRDGRLIHARLSDAEEWCIPVPLEAMGEWLPKVLVAVEDKRFYRHAGVDLLALARATGQNAAAGRVVSGASTITSQLVRISTPRQRTWQAKVLEFAGAWKLERRFSKDEILELYLNRAPFGGPIRGVEAASRLYFGKRAAELSLGEAALLVGMLKGPTAFRPDRNPQGALRRRQLIIRQMAERSGFDPDLTRLALAEPLPRYTPAMPAGAWHFADLAFQAARASGEDFVHERQLPGRLQGTSGAVASTLDSEAQRILETTLQHSLASLPETLTAAGIVVDNADASILAYVGNARFNRAAGRHWVDCALASRSPGSALKPFVYLDAFEQGKLIPASLLADTPLRLGGEAPRNYDRRYRGPVQAGFSLAHSLNVPAVRVVRLMGVPRTLHRLRMAGFAGLNRDDDYYGDSLVLGGGEVTLLELARAYTTLATLGRDRPLAALSEPRSPSPGRLFGRVPSGLAVPGPRPDRPLYSQGAGYLVAEALRDATRLPFIQQVAQEREAAPVAFKTGTSYGLRDAWAIAYTPSYTVAVWYGIPSGEGHPQLTGLGLAAPAAREALRSLEGASRTVAWYDPPAGVGYVRVCALSGAAPSAFCPSLRTSLCLPAVWRTAPCELHALRNGKTVVLWPPELEDFERLRLARPDLSRPADIRSPVPGARYLVTPGVRALPVPLAAEGVVYPVHWYADGAYVGEQTRPDVPLYWPLVSGRHTLSVLDSEERIASVQVIVVDLGARREAERPAPLFGP